MNVAFAGLHIVFSGLGNCVFPELPSRVNYAFTGRGLRAKDRELRVPTEGALQELRVPRTGLCQTTCASQGGTACSENCPPA